MKKKKKKKQQNVGRTSLSGTIAVNIKHTLGDFQKTRIVLVVNILKSITLFLIRTSTTFGAEAERSYYFWQFEPEMFLRCS